MALKHVKYHVKRIASPGSMQDSVCLGLVHWDDPEGWDGEEEGRGFPMADSCQCMAKNHYNIVK